LIADCEVAVVGAGPYGLSSAWHLRRAGVDVHVFGDPMAFWRDHMPCGMLLRSAWEASNIGDRRGELTLDAFKDDTKASFSRPVPLSDFIDYGLWFQRHAVPDVDRRAVERVETDGAGFRLTIDGAEPLRARRVVVAAGIGAFAARPGIFNGLPATLVSHSSDHTKLEKFRGHRLLVIGGGQSALESAALLHESGASVEVAVRAPRVVWLRGGTVQGKLGRAKPIFYGPTDVGPLGISRLLAHVGVSRRLPRLILSPMARRAIRPAGSRWLVERLAEVPITLGAGVSNVTGNGDGINVELEDGSSRSVDHILCGTGYRIDISRYPFLPSELAQAVERVNGYPRLGAGFESSVRGLHFVGAPAAWSYGPVMRFVSGTWYTGRQLARHVGGERRNGRVHIRAQTA
jgi:Pyridine nucleotide-disulphide oxidoreductase